MRLGVVARMDGGTEIIGVAHQGIPGNPVSGNHHLAPSHCMKIQWKRIGAYHEGRGQVGQNSTKARQGKNAIFYTMCQCNQHGTKVKPYHLPGSPQQR